MRNDRKPKAAERAYRLWPSVVLHRVKVWQNFCIRQGCRDVSLNIAPELIYSRDNYNMQRSVLDDQDCCQ